MNVIPVKAMQDESCHWYVIPNEMSVKFSELTDKMIKEDYESQETIDEFDNLFGAFRTGGDLNNIQLYMSTDTKPHPSGDDGKK